MVRSRIGSPSVGATDGFRATLLPADDAVDVGGAVPATSWREALLEAGEEAFDFVLAIVTPFLDATARTIAIGCLIAIGGCAPGEGVAIDGEIESVVRDGAPVATAPIASEDAQGAETDLGGLEGRRGDRSSLLSARRSRVRDELPRRIGRPRSSPPFDPGVPMGDAGASFPSVSSSAGGDGTAAREWSLASMSRFSRGLDDADPALRDGCTGCHSSNGFLARQRGEALLPDRDDVAPIGCETCHGADVDAAPSGLRVYDTSEPVAGVALEHLGGGALCASCHRADAARDDGAAPHAPQINLLVGRGARSVASLDDGVHRYIADTCVRCHMARSNGSDAGGHTFSIPTVSSAACAPCHGDADPSALGVRDWDGDGVAGPLADEHDRAVTRVLRRLGERIFAANIVDACGGRAVGVEERDARLHLVDADGALFGDCDRDGWLDADEDARGVNALPRALADAAWDLAMVRSDGSRGAHNPRYTFHVLAGVERVLGFREGAAPTRSSMLAD